MAKNKRFFQSRALHARALRVLGHPDFKDLKNGSTNGDAIQDPDSTPDPNIGKSEDAWATQSSWTDVSG